MAQYIRGALLAVLLCAGTADAAGPTGKKLTVGVYLPTSMTDGPSRLALGEKFAKALGESLKRPASARNFGRYEDFSKAVSAGLIDLSLVDGWVVAQSKLQGQRVANTVRARDTGKWAIVTREPTVLGTLTGAKLAVVKSLGSEASFLSSAIFMGDLDVKKHFRVVPVPDVESAVKTLEANTSQAALLPMAFVPKGFHVAYRTQKLPGAVAIVHRGDAEALGEAVVALEGIAPFDRFATGRADELEALSTLLASGGKRRHCVFAESPLVRVQPSAVLRLTDLGGTTPDFTSFIASPQDRPDE